MAPAGAMATRLAGPNYNERNKEAHLPAARSLQHSRAMANTKTTPSKLRLHKQTLFTLGMAGGRLVKLTPLVTLVALAACDGNISYFYLVCG
jgi:hypothetical protein